MATFRVTRVSFHEVPVRTRMPFRYGIAELTEFPHLFVRIEADVNGRRQVGVSADNLPPKWFTKDPHTSYADDLRDMRQVIRTAARHAIEAGACESVLAFWKAVYAAQKRWAAGTRHPPLLWNFGVSLLERAAIDAFCRAGRVPFHRALRSGALGLTHAGQLRDVPDCPDLARVAVADLLPAEPRESIHVRHTVGLSDPLDGAATVNDGLPSTLEEAIRAYDLRYFKIKLGGDPSADVRRMQDIATVLDKFPAADRFAYTLDGNENYRDPRAIGQFLEPFDYKFLGTLTNGMLFVEQPFHRDIALSQDVRHAISTPMIIDESDADLDSLPTALAMNYAGTSHKNCKGVFKGIANACLLEYLRRTGRWPRYWPYILSGEDLTNLGPVALPQDLAVMAALGIEHVERNAQHYVRGMSAFPRTVQADTVAAHGDLYHAHADGFATVRIENGVMSTRSVSAAPFGYATDFDPAVFPELPAD